MNIGYVSIHLPFNPWIKHICPFTYIVFNFPSQHLCVLYIFTHILLNLCRSILCFLWLGVMPFYLPVSSLAPRILGRLKDNTTLPHNVTVCYEVTIRGWELLGLTLPFSLRFNSDFSSVRPVGFLIILTIYSLYTALAFLLSFPYTIIWLLLGFLMELKIHVQFQIFISTV